MYDINSEIVKLKIFGRIRLIRFEILWSIHLLDSPGDWKDVVHTRIWREDGSRCATRPVWGSSSVGEQLTDKERKEQAAGACHLSLE